ncbi:RNA-binding protein [Schizosaccharomyces cryophilus OY26]|uniref:RNA-binding protein n=1 Tax=Schizosaccharomyces cryophilus (strain OY26 / ATCC MYA-4695 / CBS 11777 / NBRC 106824 / NRRL Y48691) TaxID=653667 RepID=S9W8D9_SCHCR|nr:RNA-binding protein [Schizosaccharomyces cryophilus OY26]EPY54080.1 RNA-binding protein [Schizosaccharomyces cryophilus OY26]
MAYLSSRNFLDASPSLPDPSSLSAQRSSVQLSSCTPSPCWDGSSLPPHPSSPSCMTYLPQHPSYDSSSRFFSPPSISPSQAPSSTPCLLNQSNPSLTRTTLPSTSVLGEKVSYPSKFPWRCNQIHFPTYSNSNSASPSHLSPTKSSSPSLSSRWSFQPLRANSKSHDHSLDLSLDSSFKLDSTSSHARYPASLLSHPPDTTSSTHSFSPQKSSLSGTPLLDPLSSSRSPPVNLQALSVHDLPLKPNPSQRNHSNQNISRYNSQRKALNNTLLNNSKFSQHSAPMNHLLRNIKPDQSSGIKCASPSFSFEESDCSLTPTSLPRSVPNSPIESDSIQTPSLCSSSESLCLYPEPKVSNCSLPSCLKCKNSQFFPQLPTPTVPSFNELSPNTSMTSSDPSFDLKLGHHETGQKYLYRKSIAKPAVSRSASDLTSTDENLQPNRQRGKYTNPENYRSNSKKKYSLSKLKDTEFPSLNETLGRIPSICKDQHGCRYLQKLLDENPKANASLVYHEVVSSIVELMKDPFGNYMCQKLFVYAYREQKLAILKGIGKDVVGICSDLHGTRAMQNIIDKLTSNEQISLLMRILTPSLVELACDGNGNHVLQKCIDKFLPEKLELLFFSIKRHVLKLATHRHGCCVLQRSLDATKGLMKSQLIEEIIYHALFLVQDPYGNYVIQHILEMNVEQYSESISQQFQGHICELSLQKFSSNAVEDCIRTASPSTRRWLLDEFLSYPKIEDLLNDSYANYVMQSFLMHSNDEEREKIVQLLVPLLPKISASNHGRHIIGKITEYARS